MAVLGAMLMMVKDHVAEQGMFAVLQQIAELGYDAVEVSQIPMTEANTVDLERGVAELGLAVGALSVNLTSKGDHTPDGLDVDYDKVVSDCRRLGTRFVRIGMMPIAAMVSAQACEQWASECELAAQKLLADGIQLCYHNHHVDHAKLDGEVIFDLVRRVAPSLHFEVDLHWVQRGGANPIDMLEQYTGVCDLIHLKDYRVAPPTQEVLDLIAQGRHEEFVQAFRHDAIQFGEVGTGTMNWPKILPAVQACGASYMFVEQDESYGKDPLESLKISRDYLRSIGY